MLDTFASVGATSFDVTRTTLDESKISFRRDQRLLTAQNAAAAVERNRRSRA